MLYGHVKRLYEESHGWYGTVVWNVCMKRVMADMVWSCETSVWGESWLIWYGRVKRLYEESHGWYGTVVWNVCMRTMWAEMCWWCSCHEYTGKTREEVFVCDEGHAGGRSEGWWNVWPKCTEYPLWRTLNGKAERRRKWRGKAQEWDKWGERTVGINWRGRQRGDRLAVISEWVHWAIHYFVKEEPTNEWIQAWWWQSLLISVHHASLMIHCTCLQGDDETITCIAKDNFTRIQHGYNAGFINERHRIVSPVSESAIL